MRINLQRFHKNSENLNNSETVTNQNYKEIAKERYVSSEEREKISDEMKLINLLDNTSNQQTKFRTK